MMRTMFLTAIVLGLAYNAAAQGATVNWSQPNVSTAAQAQGFTPKLYITPAGSSTSLAPITLTSVTCSGTGTAPIIATCSAPAPTAALAALITGSKSALTETDTVGGTGESAQSAFFISPAAVPTGLRIQ